MQNQACLNYAEHKQILERSEKSKKGNNEINSVLSVNSVRDKK